MAGKPLQLDLLAGFDQELEEIRARADWAPLRKKWWEALTEAAQAYPGGRKQLADDLQVTEPYLSSALSGPRGRNRCHLWGDDVAVICARSTSKAPASMLALLQGCALKEIRATPEEEAAAWRAAAAESGELGRYLQLLVREKLRGGG